ncbi:hypothetical protein HYW55_00470 [Candidatus Gottesmanbacteria bacterium]|nr:hypothetical protein [Candidatus Gottesmanbacteria bacterium]
MKTGTSARPRSPSPTGILLRLIQERAKREIKVRTDILVITVKLSVPWEVVKRLIERTDLRYSIIILQGIHRYNVPHLILVAGSRETLMQEWERRKSEFNQKGYNIHNPTSKYF